MSEFTTPSFLLNRSTNDNHAKMKAILPADLDMSEGGHAWNMTRPTALIAAEICQSILPEVIKLIFPQWSYGKFLDYHANDRGMKRRAATAAVGKLTITGAEGTVIPAGSLFSTASINGAAPVDYETLEEATIPATETVTVDVQCTQTGTIGNTGANTIVLVTSRLTSLKSVINNEPLTGGTAEENDEDLIQRIEAYDRSQGDNFVGSVADYKRWATSIDGVGSATIISAQDTSGLVTIVITDTNGDPATEKLCMTVYNYIMRPDNPEERLAPVNAFLKVVPPSTLNVSVLATVELSVDATIESVKQNFMDQLVLYLPVAMDEGEIKYTRVAAALAATEGANDFSGLQIGISTNGEASFGTANIPITNTQLPTISIEDLILTAGTV